MKSLYATLQIFADPGDQIAVIDSAGEWTWSEFLARIERFRTYWSDLRGRTVGLTIPADMNGLASLAAMDALEVDLFLLDSQSPLSLLREYGTRFQWDETITEFPNREPPLSSPRDAGKSPSVPGVSIVTSGTEGPPKVVQHTWESLLRPVRRFQGGRDARWVLAFRPHLYAGLQVIAQALANGGSMVAPVAEWTPEQLVQFLARTQSTHASATPSYWRRLTMFVSAEELRAIPLRQVTLGGEPVDQSLLDQLRVAFPAARIAHIYATTELGRCFSVTDGRAGFPAEWLRPGALPHVALDIRDGELWVRSVHGGRLRRVLAHQVPQSPPDNIGTSPTDDWVATGDVVDL
ncbi:MAG TPA: class I adenylate-forming enzyme family protein, partial [Pirellulaceae bacterium]